MKISICGDVHWCTYSSILRKRGSKYSLRLENLIQSVNWFLDTARKEGCSDVFFLGDFFDSNTLTAEEVSALSQLSLNDKDIVVSFLVGNHEMGLANLEYSTAHSFLLNSTSNVWDKPTILAIGDCLVYILPYELEVNRKKSIKEYFPAESFRDSGFSHRILLSHNDIKGIQMGKFISKEGFELEELSKTFDLVINGHLHNQEWVSKNVLNLGNITGQNFSEDATRYKHQCMILDCDTLEYKLITNPYALNFSKLDFTGKNDNIDYINNMSQLTGNNAVVSIKCNEENYNYIKHRFDPDVPEDKLIPRNCNIIQSRIIVERNVAEENSETKVETLRLDYLQEFSDYITSTLGTSETVIKELQQVIGR